MKRRSFVKSAAAAGTLMPFTLSGMGLKTYEDSPLLQVLGRRAGATDKILVIIQLNGGNDGLNTLIPTDQYSNLSKARSNVLIQENKVLSLSGKTGVGLHPKLTGLRDMYNAGLVSAVQCVGYPQPNFSHFRSTDIWMSGSNADEVFTTGWMGRYLDMAYPEFPAKYPNATMPDPLAIQIGQVVGLQYMGPTVTMGMAITDPSTFYELVDGTTGQTPSTPYGDELAFLRLVTQQTNQYADVIKGAAAKGKNYSTKYTTSGRNSSLSDQLKIVAKLINGGLKTPVYMVSLGGFDTHSQQVDTSDTSNGSHANLMQQLGDAIAAFQDDLKLMGIQDRVAGMTFSEFGRRVMSNASDGTDHGAAAPLFVFGTSVQPGIIGSNPTIPSTVTVNDNLPMQYDFRQVYASVLQDWFGLTDTELKVAMGNKDFNTLPIFKNNKAKIEDYVDLVSRISLNAIYPNPHRGRVSVDYFTESGNLQLCVFDARGTLIDTVVSGWHSHGSYTIQIDTSQYGPGNYFVQLSQGEKRFTEVLLVP